MFITKKFSTSLLIKYNSGNTYTLNPMSEIKRLLEHFHHISNAVFSANFTIYPQHFQILSHHKILAATTDFIRSSEIQMHNISSGTYSLYLTFSNPSLQSSGKNCKYVSNCFLRYLSQLSHSLIYFITIHSVLSTSSFSSFR